MCVCVCVWGGGGGASLSYSCMYIYIVSERIKKDKKKLTWAQDTTHLKPHDDGEVAEWWW